MSTSIKSIAFATRPKDIKSVSITLNGKVKTFTRHQLLMASDFEGENIPASFASLLTLTVPCELIRNFRSTEVETILVALSTEARTAPIIIAGAHGTGKRIVLK